MKELNELPEAPASVTYSIVSPTGYNALFTIREMTGLDLLTKMTALEKKLDEMGYKPQIKTSFGQKKEVVYVPNAECPKCKGRLIDKTSKNGKRFHECENRKYDFKTGVTSGCEYINWL